MNETQRVLTDALELLRCSTWVNRAPIRQGCHCAYTALEKVMGPRRAMRCPAYKALIRVSGTDTVADGNDSLSTFDEVEAWFARAIEIAGKDGSP